MTDRMINVTKRLFKGIVMLAIGISFGIIISFAVSNTHTEKGDEDSAISTAESDSKKVKSISIEYLQKKLENTSKLMTAEMTYQGIYTVQSGEIPLLTKNGFKMSYEATVTAGIDTSLIMFEVTDDKVTVLLPDSTIQGIHVDPNSIQFFDEKKALFNWSKKIDVTEAITQAEADAKSQADVDGINRKASLNAKRVIRSLLIDAIGDRELEVIAG